MAIAEPNSTSATLIGRSDTEETDRGMVPICADDPYPRYPPGKYEVVCIAAKTYTDPRYRRAVCWLRFAFTAERGAEISAFANLGRGNCGRGSKYWRWWVIANAGELPKKRQRMSPRVFTGKIFQVSVRDVKKRDDGETKQDFEVYSVVDELLRRNWP